MTPKERFLKTISFEKVDRVPVMDFGYWDETIDVWHEQGLPADVKTYAQVEDYFGLDRGFELNEVQGFLRGFYPRFERKIVEETDDTMTYYDTQGVLLKAKKRFGSIPHYIKFPVETMKDFESLLPRLEPKAPEG